MGSTFASAFLDALRRRRRNGSAWDRVAVDPRAREACSAHGLAPWLLPGDDEERLAVTARNAARAAVLEDELEALLEAVGREELLVLKGPALDRELYGGRGVRGYDDLDLLVRPRTRAAFIRVLLDKGFRKEKEDEVEEKWSRRHDSGFWISVDARIAMKHPRRRHRAYEVDTESLFAGRRPVDGAGGPWWVPGLEDGLLYLCVHAGEHAFERLVWALDLSLYAEAHGATLRWEELAARARDLRIRQVVATAARVCELLFDRPWPPAALAAIGPCRLTRWVEPWLRHVLLAAPRPRWSRRHRNLLRLLLVDRPLDALRWSARRLIPRWGGRP